MATRTWQGLAIFQARSPVATLGFNVDAGVKIVSHIYVASATVKITGDADLILNDSLYATSGSLVIADELTVSGEGPLENLA